MRRIAVLLSLLCLCGCANRAATDRETARAAVRTFLDQCAAGRADRVLATLNRSGRDAFAQAGGVARGCAAILKARGPLDPAALRGARIDTAGFDGDQAAFDVRVGATTTFVRASRVSEGWQLEGPS